jgi:hypothetical protein
MKTQSIDTHPQAEAVQIALLRQASMAKRAWLLRSLSQTVIRLSRRAIRKVNPQLTEPELNVLFVRHCYGDELADRLQQYLMRRTSDGTS